MYKDVFSLIITIGSVCFSISDTGPADSGLADEWGAGNEAATWLCHFCSAGSEWWLQLYQRSALLILLVL